MIHPIHPRPFVHSYSAASPSPPSSQSSPLATTKPPTLPAPGINSIWNDHSNSNPSGRLNPNDTSDEGTTSRFFSSRTSSIGSTNSAESSPPRWSIQHHAQPQNPPVAPNSYSRQAYPAMHATHSQNHEQDMHFDYRLSAPAAERELHVVLPEPWMDAPYVLQMAHAQGWEVLDVRMQTHGAVLVFASTSGAARAFAQVNGSVEGVAWIGSGTAGRVQAHWAGAVGRANEEELQTYVTARPGAAVGAASGAGGNAAKQLEFSIFVGDLAPETTNADLVAVFRNPLLGLRADREPRVIRPFASCRSAKIMVSPETGVSKGYGFVRFTDEADQQRALIEMQGLYCLSRPMRLSHATAKTKPLAGSASNAPNGNGSYNQYIDELDPYMLSVAHPDGSFGRAAGQEMYARMGQDAYGQGVQDGYARGGQDGFGRSVGRHSVSGPDAYYARNGTGEYAPPRSRSADAEDMFGPDGGRAGVLGVEGGRVLGVEGGRGMMSPAVGTTNANGGLSEGARLESARALLGVLNSADPYNTTVFVGGLSGLIAEETLRGFFAPFGEIHYVKIPPGKGCGFVQFVRKADAERAIERMQGFPIGGGKIRLSWGRSQSDKAAQAAAQAAQLGLNLGGLHLNSLSATDSARLFQTLEALGYSSVPSGALPGQGQGQGFQTGFQGTQNGFQGQQNSFQFSATQPFQNNSPSGPLSPQSAQQGTFGQQNQFSQSIHSQQPSLYEPSSAGFSRAYTSVGSGFQPFSSDPAPSAMGYSRGSNAVMGSGERGISNTGSAPMGHSASASAHPATQPYSNRHSLAFEPEAFGLGGRERRLTAPAHANIKNLNLGLAGMNLSQRRDFGLDGGPLSAPLRSPNNGGMKPSVPDNNVYIH